MANASATNLTNQLKTDMDGPSWIIWLSAATVFLFIGWAYFAWVDEIVRGDGVVISSSKPQIIQNLEGGILAELSVAEGDIVERGQVLAQLQGTKFQSQVDDLVEQVVAFEVKRIRLEAEMKGETSFTLSSTLEQHSPDIVASEKALLKARQLDFESRRSGAEKVLAQAKKERDLLEGLLEKKVVSLIEATRARKAYADAKIRLDEIITQTELERAQEYSDVLKELATLKQNLKASQDQLDRTTLVSPMRGVVNNLAITTIGGVVRSGEEIMQIIPVDEELFIEAKIKPENIANIRKGQEATIKLSAYDYTIFGSLRGTVDYVSADTFKDERSRQPDGNPHYKVTLKVDRAHLTERQQMLEIRPGMQAQVELHTGEKTILQYLMKPLYKSREAFREP